MEDKWLILVNSILSVMFIAFTVVSFMTNKGLIFVVWSGFFAIYFTIVLIYIIKRR